MGRALGLQKLGLILEIYTGFWLITESKYDEFCQLDIQCQWRDKNTKCCQNNICKSEIQRKLCLQDEFARIFSNCQGTGGTKIGLNFRDIQDFD